MSRIISDFMSRIGTTFLGELQGAELQKEEIERILPVWFSAAWRDHGFPTA